MAGLNQTIIAADLQQFIVICAALVREGVTYEAHAATLRVHLTGGY